MMSVDDRLVCGDWCLSTTHAAAAGRLRDNTIITKHDCWHSRRRSRDGTRGSIATRVDTDNTISSIHNDMISS